MCEVLDRVENRGIEKGRQEGIEKGRQEGIEKGRILEYIDIRREDGYSEDEIQQGIVRKFKLTEEEAANYLKDEHMVLV